MKVANGTKRDSDLKPLRLKPSQAAKVLSIGYESVLELCHRGLFTVFDNGKLGRDRRIHVLTEEVEIYATQGEDALREFRAKKKRKSR